VRDAASRLDALAVSELAMANTRLSVTGSRLLLVTRSSHMHQIFEEEREGGLWAHEPDGLLRHPRVLALLSGAGEARRGIDRMLEELNRRLVGIDLVLHTSATREMTRSRPGKLGAELLANIKEDWQAIEGLSASLGEATGLGVANADRARATWFLGLLRGQHGLQELLRARVRQLDEELERDHAVLGLYVESASAEARHLLREHIVTERGQNRIVLRATLQAMPHALEFHSERARSLLATAGSWREWRDLMSIFTEGFTASAQYEPLLAMAYLLGTLSRWQLAEQYAERALELAGREGGESPHEGLFFLALCKRKFNSSEQRHLEALEYLDRAEGCKRACVGDETFEDVRYVKEKGTHILALHLLRHARERRDGFVREAGPGCPSEGDGLAMLERAKELAGEDVSLRMQVLNNILYYRVETAQFGDRQRTQDDLAELERLLRSIDPDESSWPAAVLDTIAWTEWRLSAGEDATVRRRVVRRIRSALHSDELEQRERGRIEAHLRTVEEQVEGGRRRRTPRSGKR
jgi:hypothetical protein